MVAAEEVRDVPGGDVGELLTAFEGQHTSVVADRAQQGEGERTGADSGLDDGGTGEHIAHRGDEGRVLRIDHGGSARHRQHEVLVPWPHRLELDACGAVHGHTGRSSEQIIMLDPPLVGVELLPGHQDDGVEPAAGIRELHFVAGSERSAQNAGAGGSRVVRGGIHRLHSSRRHRRAGRV